MSPTESIEGRRGMLARWYLDALHRHDRLLRSTRSRAPVRVNARSYFVTGEQLHHALDSTYSELHCALAQHTHWGADANGEPSASAVVGLAQRRLQARLVDEIRRSRRTPEAVDLSETRVDRYSVASEQRAEPVEQFALDLLTELSRESAVTQAVVLLASAGFASPEIAERVGLKPAAARQRLSRFGRRLRLSAEAA